MGAFSFNGADELEVSFEELAKLDEEERGALLDAAAAEVLRHQQEYVRLHHHRTGGLEGSLRAERYGNVVLVGPRGKISWNGRRKILQKVKGSKSMKRSKHHGAVGGITYPELGFLLEYGTPRMKASHWMENANEEAAEDVHNAVAQAWDEHLRKMNL